MANGPIYSGVLRTGERWYSAVLDGDAAWGEPSELEPDTTGEAEREAEAEREEREANLLEWRFEEGQLFVAAVLSVS